MKDFKQINKDNNTLTREYRNASPDTMQAFAQLHKSAIRAGALSVKEKELIALGIGICVRCDVCIGAHVAAALAAGASREEITEAIDVAVLMGGGPSVAYGSQALAAVDQLADQTR